MKFCHVFECKRLTFAIGIGKSGHIVPIVRYVIISNQVNGVISSFVFTANVQPKHTYSANTHPNVEKVKLEKIGSASICYYKIMILYSEGLDRNSISPKK